jgi:hypothetical protein
MITMPFFIGRTSNWKRFLYTKPDGSSLGGASRREVEMMAPVAGRPVRIPTPIQARHAPDADHVAVKGLPAAFVEVIACFMIARRKQQGRTQWTDQKSDWKDFRRALSGRGAAL